MLSFDITDRSIKIVEGIEKKGKIKVYTLSTIEIDEGIIQNGIVEKVSDLAMIINKELVTKKMQRKEAVICISSNLTTFKEIDVPKAKGGQFKTMVQNKLQQVVNVYEEQSVGYTVMTKEDESENSTVKVLATSCPRTLVESYKKVFSLLKISLKDMSISCNCISNIITSDKNYKKMMPFILVEVDPDYININIFENENLSFSRFATISPDNYDDKDDYMFQAINENIFRLLQFQDMRRKQPIHDIVFYGDTTLFERLKKHLHQMGMNCSLLKVNNSSVHTDYANAMGALINANKSNDSTNLLDKEIDTTQQVQVSATSVGLQIGSYFLAGLATVLIAFAVMNIYNGKISEKIETIDTYVNSPEVVQSLQEVKTIEKDMTDLKENRIKLATITDFINSQPVLRSEVFKQIDDSFDGSNYDFENFAFSNGIVSESYLVEDNTISSEMVKKIINYKNNFNSVNYNGYVLTEKEKYRVNLSLILNGDIDLEKQKAILDSYNVNDVAKDGDE